MVVDHADGLHVPVDHGGSDEAESPPLQIATERIRLWRRRGNLAYGFPSTLSRPAVDESPAIRIEAPVFFLHRQKRSRVLHRGGDLHAVPYDPWIGGQLVDPGFRVSSDLLWIEVAERAAVAVPLVEHDRPAEPRLRGLQNQELEMRAVVVRRHTPFAIVILAHQHVVDVDPGTALRLRIRHVSRLLAVDKSLHTVWRRADIRRPIRGQNDKNSRVVQEGFEAPEMNSPQEGRCEHS